MNQRFSVCQCVLSTTSYKHVTQKEIIKAKELKPILQYLYVYVVYAREKNINADLLNLQMNLDD
jgi:hypothetical protein